MKDLFDHTMPHCRVPNCKEKHNKHYCRVCKNPDSTHFSRHCQRGENAEGHCLEVAFKCPMFAVQVKWKYNKYCNRY